MQLKLLSLESKELRTGIWPAINYREIPLWETSNNVVFTPTGVRKAKGWITAVAATAAGFPLRGMGQILQNDGTGHVYYGDKANLYRWPLSGAATIVGSGFTGITDATATAPATVWSMQPYGDWMLHTNGVDVPKVTKGSAASTITLAGVAGNFTTAQIFSLLNEHIIALNTSNGPYEIRWSSAGNAELWTPGTTNTSGFLSLREARSPIIAACKLHQYLGVYTKESLFLLEYVGSPALRFRVTHAIDGIGAVSKCSVIPVGGMNYGLGPQGFWKTDGGTFEYIDDPAIRAWFFNTTSGALFNRAQQSKVCGWHNEEETSVIWDYPGNNDTDNSRRIVYNYRTEAWSTRDFGRTLGSEKNVHTYPFSASTTGVLYTENNGLNSDGSATFSLARTKTMTFGDETVTKVITGVRLTGTSTNNLIFKVGYKDKESDTVTYGPTVAAPSGDITPYRIAGKYIVFQVENNQTSETFDLYGVDFYGRFAGREETS